MRNKFVVTAIAATLMANASISNAESSSISDNVLTVVEIVIEAPEIANSESVKALLEELKAEGFTYIEVKRTFLGRARIIAISATEIREIILNATTAEVLRDLAQGNSVPNPEDETGSVEDTLPANSNSNAHENHSSGHGNNPGVEGNNKGGLGNGGNAGGGERN